MDLVLNIADSLVLDAVWSKVVPITAFTHGSLNATTAGTWNSLVSHLPHPPLEQAVFSYANATTSGQNFSYSNISAWPRDYIPRQLLSLIVITLLGIHALYFIFASFSYYFIFNHDMMKHPRFLKNQVRLEIQTSLGSFPWMMLLTLPWFQGEVMGYSKLYYDVDEYGWTWLVLSVPLFLLFTDYCIYWIHRWLHIPFFYKMIHKPHHKWLVPTPFASHAFHPVDGYLQSVPYHLYIFLFPMHGYLYLGLFVAINFWTIFIHDSDMVTGHPLENVINGPAHHTLHHLYFTCNYGQYFTWADKTYKSYRHPQSSLDPLLEVPKDQLSEASKKSLKTE